MIHASVDHTLCVCMCNVELVSLNGFASSFVIVLLCCVQNKSRIGFRDCFLQKDESFSFGLSLAIDSSSKNVV